MANPITDINLATGSSRPRTMLHGEVLDYNHGKGDATFKVEGRGFNNSTEVVNIVHEYGLENERGLFIAMKIQNSRGGGLHIEMRTEANFVLVPRRQQKSITGSGSFSVSEIQTESYSYGPSGTTSRDDDRGVFIVEKAIGNGCVRMLRITHKYYNAERDGPLTIEHKKDTVGNGKSYTARKCYSLCFVVKIGIARNGCLHVKVEFSDSQVPPTPINLLASILSNNKGKGGNQNVRGLVNSSGTTVGDGNGCIIFHQCNF
ncbi:hypothetical protein O6P43_003649 [Quillaja saponaria]|uniref:Uncharacterized protein n=1 Tax=Quillaja saponaria TaxID=32244 RepID=A0AAD7VLS6_QUISA|nr:hypothetical protein O6P43_003649 [Quillaja saponaria]